MRRNHVLLSRFHFNFVAVLLLGLVFPFAAAGQGTSNGIKLPSIYQDKLDDFLVNNNVMKNSNAKSFTMNFVEKEMETDWKISKENQLLFIWHTIYKELTNQDLYDGKDGVPQIAEDFGNKNVITKIRICRQKYRNGYTAYMNQSIAETIRMTIDGTLIKIDEGIEKLAMSISKYEKEQLKQEALQELASFKQEKERIENRVKSIKTQLGINQYSSSELKTISDETKQLFSDVSNLRIIVEDRRIAEAHRQTMHLDSIGIKQMVEFYDIYITRPSIVKQEELVFMKESIIEVINQCKKYGIDYRAVLLKETGDGKKVDAILKFYGIAD